MACGPELLHVTELVQRISNPEEISEVILALTPSVEGRHHQPVSGAVAQALLLREPHRLRPADGQ